MLVQETGETLGFRAKGDNHLSTPTLRMTILNVLNKNNLGLFSLAFVEVIEKHQDTRLRTKIIFPDYNGQTIGDDKRHFCISHVDCFKIQIWPTRQGLIVL